MTDLITTCRALRVWRHGKPVHVRWDVENAIYCLRSIARGRATPQLYAALNEKLDRLREYTQSPHHQL